MVRSYTFCLSLLIIPITLISADPDNIYDASLLPPSSTADTQKYTVNTSDLPIRKVNKNTTGSVVYTAPALTETHIYPVHTYANASGMWRKGKFYIYTAVNQKRQFENPWYCLFRMEMEAIAVHEHYRIVPGTPKNYQFTYAHYLLSPDNDALCDATVTDHVKFLSEPHNILQVGPMVIYTYARLLKGKKWEKKLDERVMYSYKASYFDLKELYIRWPEHYTKVQLATAVVRQAKEDSGAIPINSFRYDVSPSSSPESSKAPIFDIVAKSIKQGSIVYKLT